MKLETGKWYWARIDKFGETLPVLRVGTPGMFPWETVQDKGGTKVTRLADREVEVIRPLEDPPGPPFERGYYWAKGKDHDNWHIYWYIEAPDPRYWILGKKVEEPEEYQ